MLAIRNFKENEARKVLEALNDKFVEGVADGDISKSPFIKKLLSRILSEKSINLNGEKLVYAKIREVAFDDDSVITEIIFLVAPDSQELKKVDACFVMGIESTVKNTEALKFKYKNYRNIYCRQVRLDDLYRYVGAIKYDRKYKGCNNVLYMATELTDKDGNVRASFK